MAKDDIYNSKLKYERFVTNLEKVLVGSPRREYYCKNRDNYKYFNTLIRSFEIDDISYTRRIRVLYVMKFLTYAVECDLKDATENHRNDFIIEMRKRFKPSNLKRYASDIKMIGRRLFGKNNIQPFFTEFTIRVDPSQIEEKQDKLTTEEFIRILKYFSENPTTSAFLSIIYETMVRPQELLYRKIKDIEWYENYAIIRMTSHGKEGPKKLLCIDSYPYLLKLYNTHCKRTELESYLFLNERGRQLRPTVINEKLKRACKVLNIQKPIRCYSFKRYGVTARKMRGESDNTIQKLAGFKTKKPLRIYDLSNQEDVFKVELAKRGLIKDRGLEHLQPKTQECPYCNEIVGFAEDICPRCKHILNKNMIKQQLTEHDELKRGLVLLNNLFDNHPELFNKMAKNLQK